MRPSPVTQAGLQNVGSDQWTSFCESHSERYMESKNQAKGKPVTTVRSLANLQEQAEFFIGGYALLVWECMIQYGHERSLRKRNFCAIGLFVFLFLERWNIGIRSLMHI